MEKFGENYLILNIHAKGLTIQINKQTDYKNICYNIEFEKQDNCIRLKGFVLPGLFDYNYFDIYGDKDTKVIVHCLKVLPILFDKSKTILEFIAGIIKKEKLTMYQININGSMDYSRSVKIDLFTLSEIRVRLEKAGFILEF